jgi:hypothetical protein
MVCGSARAAEALDAAAIAEGDALFERERGIASECKEMDEEKSFPVVA